MSSETQIALATADGERIRRRILDAAERTFAERGYAGASTREIAYRAGIGKRMLFYYFPSKDALYQAVLARVVLALGELHERWRREPSPLGPAEAASGLLTFAAANLGALKLLLREIMDGGPRLHGLAREHLAPLVARGTAEVERGIASGVFPPGDPVHTLLNVGGLTLFYLLLVPLLELIWDRNPLDPATLAERAAAVRDCLVGGVASPPAPSGGGTVSGGALDGGPQRAHRAGV